METLIYPSGPKILPKGLTNMSGSYQVRSILAVLSVFIFFVLYFVLVASLGI